MICKPLNSSSKLVTNERNIMDETEGNSDDRGAFDDETDEIRQKVFYDDDLCIVRDLVRRSG